MVAKGAWKPEIVPASVTGLGRDITIFRAARAKKTMLLYNWHGDKNTICPPLWWDLAIGSGACNMACLACFLLLTHRSFRDPLRPVLYDNVREFESQVRRWLLAIEWKHPYQKGNVKLTRKHTLGLGIDRSDSLLYEGVTGHARRLIPLFAHPATNPQGRRLVLLTKSANVHYLDYKRGVDPRFRDAMQGLVEPYRVPSVPNISVTFSLNPQEIARLWEGKWPDTEELIAPPVGDRLESARLAQSLGYDVRFRLDPILPVGGWEWKYNQFFEDVREKHYVYPTRITLGTYRQKNTQLDIWRQKWGLPAPEFDWRMFGGLSKEGTHFRMPEEKRIEVYSSIANMIKRTWPVFYPKISLCKETHSVTRSTGLGTTQCNCL
jgi:hypothetical protein